MSGFERALEFTIGNGKTTFGQEGGWAPQRDGGTFRGIARDKHPEWNGWELVDALPEPKAPPWGALLELRVRVFYSKEFWDRIGGDQLPPKVALQLFDFAVQSGTGGALKTVQRWAGLEGDAIDGGFGPTTLAAIIAQLDRQGANEILRLRGARLLSWANNAAHPERKNDVRGFENRLRALNEALA